ncbi:hypothetical protein ACVWYN_001611 [Pedobacter sp. UYP24]
MKIKLTPLNIVSAVCLTAAILLLYDKKELGNSTASSGIVDLMAGLSILAGIIAFISDQIFRKFVPSIKKLWIIEGVLIVFMIILIFIIRTSTR